MRFLKRVLRFLGLLSEDEDPHSYVRHPRNPRTPLRSSAVALEEPND